MSAILFDVLRGTKERSVVLCFQNWTKYQQVYPLTKTEKHIKHCKMNDTALMTGTQYCFAERKWQVSDLTIET